MTEAKRVSGTVLARDIPENPRSKLSVEKEKMSVEELREELRKEYGHGKWADRVIDEEIRNRGAARNFRDAKEREEGPSRPS